MAVDDPTLCYCGKPKSHAVLICAACLASVLPSIEDIGRMFDEARARHIASGAPSTTREEADRKVAVAVAEAYRKLGMEPPS